MACEFTVNLNLGGGFNVYLPPPPEPPTIEGRLTWYFGAITITGVSPMATTFPIDQPPMQAKVTWVDKSGNAAQVDGPTSWASSDETIVTVTVDPNDSTAAVVTAVGTIGSAQITSTADAIVGTGVQNIIAIGDITTVAGTAVAGSITFTPGV